MRLKPELKGALLALLGVSLILIGFWIYTGVRLGIWTYRDYDRYVWLTANLPVAYALWHDQIKAGDNAEQLITNWRPHQITKFGPWIELRWYPHGPSTNSISFIGVCVIAKDGILVYASSYSDDGVLDRIIFNTMEPPVESEFNAAYKVYGEGLQIELEKKRSQPTLPAGQHLQQTPFADFYATLDSSFRINWLTQFSGLPLPPV